MSDLSDSVSTTTAGNALRTRNAIILGACIIAAAICHAVISSPRSTTVQPIHAGIISGDMLVREQGGVTSHKCNGFKIECYCSFVVVYVDKAKEPTWTGNYVKTIPWSKIEYLTLADPNDKS